MTIRHTVGILRAIKADLEDKENESVIELQKLSGDESDTMVGFVLGLIYAKVAIEDRLADYAHPEQEY